MARSIAVRSSSTSPRQIPGEEALDGMKMDVRGNLYLSAPGGVWIFDSKGTHLGTITAPKPVHNFAWAAKTAERSICARAARCTGCS